MNGKFVNKSQFNCLVLDRIYFDGDSERALCDRSFVLGLKQWTCWLKENKSHTRKQLKFKSFFCVRSELHYRVFVCVFMCVGVLGSSKVTYFMPLLNCSKSDVYDSIIASAKQQLIWFNLISCSTVAVSLCGILIMISIYFVVFFLSLSKTLLLFRSFVDWPNYRSFIDCGGR